MKRPGLTPHFLSATLFLSPFLAGLTASAAEPMSATSAAKAARRNEELLRRFDKNGDGKLDDDERAEAKEAMMKEQIDKQMERAAAAAGGAEAFRARMLEFFDKNRDGRLDDEERAAAEKFAQDRAAGSPAAAALIREELLKRFDKNANGTIDPEERPALAEFLGVRAGEIPSIDRRETADAAALEKVLRAAVEADEAQRRRFDADGDGKLSDREWLAARLQIARALAAGVDPTRVALSPEQEQVRLQRVADELARRRKVREDAAKSSEPAK